MSRGRLLITVLLSLMTITGPVSGSALAAEPEPTTLTLSVSPTAIKAGQSVNASATVSYFGGPVPSGHVRFLLPAVSGDTGTTYAIVPVVDGFASATLDGLGAGERTLSAEYLPAYNSPIPGATTTQAISVTKFATTTSVSVSPSLNGGWNAVPTITSVNGTRTFGECTTYLDGVSVGFSTCTGHSVQTTAPGVHTVRVDYLPDPFGIPSDRDRYEPSSGTTTFEVPAPSAVTPPPVTTTPPAPTGPVATTLTASYKKKVRAGARALIRATVQRPDGQKALGQVILKLKGPRDVIKKTFLTDNVATFKPTLKRAGTYKGTVTFVGNSRILSSVLKLRIKVV